MTILDEMVQSEVRHFLYFINYGRCDLRMVCELLTVQPASFFDPQQAVG